jgi:hypothetical protein
MCMQDNYFPFNGHFYRQTFSTSMDNALSPFLANIITPHMETQLSKLKIFLKVRIRYVDDIFCVMKKNTIDRMLENINRRHNTIKFTHEVEDKVSLVFFEHTNQTCRKKNSHSTSTANLRPLLDTFRLCLTTASNTNQQP